MLKATQYPAKAEPAIRRQATQEALRAAQKRVLEALVRCTALVREASENGDPLAKYLQAELDAAWDNLVAENVGAFSELVLSPAAFLRRDEGAAKSA